MSTKIIVLGDNTVGKTSIIKRFCFPFDTPKTQKTIGIECTSRIVDFNNTIYKIQFWDVAGGTEWIGLYPNYIKNSDIALVVYDVSNKETFFSIKKWIEMIRDHNGKKFPVVVIANKIDKESSRVVDHQTYKVYTENFNENVFLIETNTVDKNGCDHALKCILSLLQPKKVMTMSVPQKSWYDKWFA